MPKYRIVPAGTIKKDLNTALEWGYNLDLLGVVVDTLAARELAPEKYKETGKGYTTLMSEILEEASRAL